MKRYTRRSVFQALISISALFCLPHPTFGVEPDTEPAGEERVWTETRLVLSPVLQEKIDRTNQFLDSHTPRLGDQLDQLKLMGYVDRRTKSAIDSTISDARQSLSGLEVAKNTGQLGAWRARTIAYELGMAGDVLAKQSEIIEASLVGTNEKATAAGSEQQALVQTRIEIAETLATMSRYLRETARAIVHNLK